MPLVNILALHTPEEWQLQVVALFPARLARGSLRASKANLILGYAFARALSARAIWVDLKLPTGAEALVNRLAGGFAQRLMRR